MCFLIIVREDMNHGGDVDQGIKWEWFVTH